MERIAGIKLPAGILLCESKERVHDCGPLRIISKLDVPGSIPVSRSNLAKYKHNGTRLNRANEISNAKFSLKIIHPVK
jgi:hypothetical protein